METWRVQHQGKCLKCMYIITFSLVCVILWSVSTATSNVTPTERIRGSIYSEKHGNTNWFTLGPSYQFKMPSAQELTRRTFAEFVDALGYGYGEVGVDGRVGHNAFHT